jgi:hypothetical protein
MSLDRLTAKCPTCGAALVSQEQEDGGLALTYECGAVGLLSEKAAEEGRLWEVRWSRMCPEPQRARETERAERIMTSEGIDPAIDREAVAGLTADA